MEASRFAVARIMVAESEGIEMVEEASDLIAQDPSDFVDYWYCHDGNEKSKFPQEKVGPLSLKKVQKLHKAIESNREAYLHHIGSGHTDDFEPFLFATFMKHVSNLCHAFVFG